MKVLDSKNSSQRVIQTSRLAPGAIAVMVISYAIANPVLADTPLGWINNNNPSAYTTTARQLEIAAAYLAVNDSLDVLNIRSDLLAGQQQLIGKSGDLKGQRLDLNYGILSTLSVFYTQQQQEFTVELGTLNSVKLVRSRQVPGHQDAKRRS